MRLPNPQHSWAILIGSSSYADGKLNDLPTVRNNITELKRVLTGSPGGILLESHCLTLVDEGDLRRLGSQLRIATSQAEDLLLVYYAGHGLIGGKRHELYLALPDSEWESPEFNSLEYDKLRSAILDSPAANKIAILDCCFSGRALGDLMADPDTAVLGQLDVHGTYILTSAQSNQAALVLPDEEYTAFSGRLLQLLKDGVVGGPELLTIDYLYRKLRAGMEAEGLSIPDKRATRTAGSIALAPNNAFSSTAISGALGTQQQESISTKASHTSRTPPGLKWDVFRASRGNESGNYTIFHGRRHMYWTLSILTTILGLLSCLIAATAQLSLIVKIPLAILGLFLLVLIFGFLQMARSPVRLEIGSQGIQLFARSGTTWIPWEFVSAVDIERANGNDHIVVWLNEADIFPDFDTFGGGPQFIPKMGAIALCSINVLSASRHQIARTLWAYGGESVKKSTVRQSMDTERSSPPASLAPQQSDNRDQYMSGQKTADVLQLSQQEAKRAKVEYAPPRPAPQSGAKRIVRRTLLITGTILFGVMTMGAIGAAASGGYENATYAVIGNAFFEAPLVVLMVFLVKDIRSSRARKIRSEASTDNRHDKPPRNA
ncbi:caspase family protein [Microbispora amethystogenes]|uniref:Peptidase C14 caspase domain-containing protein n=1 Tax=Microbispora amethystogenes TaxID=1427754 RepID=A0ABQ4FNF6_9ACTN|nr:caspase family protein [Microbispora amethystogenes]GIH36288.1 hypothetical protein Mam01_64520 [Microbispora amethystogenes]